jgi:hypothetical protein
MSFKEFLLGEGSLGQDLRNWDELQKEIKKVAIKKITPGRKGYREINIGDYVLTYYDMDGLALEDKYGEDMEINSDPGKKVEIFKKLKELKLIK